MSKSRALNSVNKNIIDVGDPCFQFCQLKFCPKLLQFLDLSSHLFFTIIGNFGQFLAVLGRHFGSGKISEVRNLFWSEQILGLEISLGPKKFGVRNFFGS